MKICMSISTLKVQAKIVAIFKGKNCKQELLGEKHKRVEDWMCCIRERELGNVFDEMFFSLEVLHLSKSKEKGERKRKGRDRPF